MTGKFLYSIAFVLVVGAGGVSWAAVVPAPAAGSRTVAAQAVAASGEARALAGAGASQLAIKLVNASQPPFAKAPAAWSAWERARLDILSAADDDAALYKRIRALPDKASDALRVYAYQVGARAALNANNSGQARNFLRRLIWSRPPPAPAALAGYRQLVLRSYVVGGMLVDAERALAYRRRSGSRIGAPGKPRPKWHWNVTSRAVQCICFPGSSNLRCARLCCWPN